MSTDPTVVTHPAPAPRRTNWLGIVALVLVCAMIGTLGGAFAGGAAGYFFGRRAARSEIAKVEASTPAPQRNTQPQPTLPPEGWSLPWPRQGQVPNAAVYAQVESVVEGSPADKAGLQAGDRILEVDGTRLTLRRDLAQAITAHKVGDQVELTIDRNGNEQRIKVTLGENPDKPGTPYLGLTYTMAAGVGGRYPSS